jgi:hypothetical protein
MNIVDQWRHRWFGVWREYGPKYKDCPSIREFVAPELVTSYDKKRLREYLLSGQIVASTSRASFPCPFTGTRHKGSISFRTDGEWLWLDDLPDYIDQFDVAIPSAWLHSIKARDYQLRPVDEQAVMALEWPPTSK